jgi:hypothetical protein
LFFQPIDPGLIGGDAACGMPCRLYVHFAFSFSSVAAQHLMGGDGALVESQVRPLTYLAFPTSRLLFRLTQAFHREHRQMQPIQGVDDPDETRLVA